MQQKKMFARQCLAIEKLLKNRVARVDFEKVSGPLIEMY